jgi:phosphohistidine phosphatase
MKLYLFRHGIAADREDFAGEDAERPLTEEGTRKTRLAARGLRRLAPELDLILSSPLRRARQTAELLVEAYEGAPPLECSDRLAEEGAHEALIRELRARRPVPRRLLLVGHEPNLSELAGLLLTGLPTLAMRFKKAGACRLTWDRIDLGPGAVLDWFLPPKALRALA